MARAATSQEKTYFRLDGQSTRLYLTNPYPLVTVYSARLDTAPASNDKVAEIDYTSGSGTLANIEPGMTLFVGTSAGANDKGECRVRKAPSGSVIYIGETSEIVWASGDYLTVIDEFLIWPRHIRMSGTTPLVDYDIAYSDQHTLFGPVPILGSDAVAWLGANGTVTVSLTAANSWVFDSSIASYAWTVTGGTLSSASSSAPTLTVSATGRYRATCEVTAANGKTMKGHRYVHVYSGANPPLTEFKLESCSGSWAGGGWSFRVTMFGQASTIRKRAPVTLFARDWYGATETSIGALANRENVIAHGWIADEEFDYSPDPNTVTFEVQGPQYWFGQMTGFPVGVEWRQSASDAWTNMAGLTVNKGIWHFLHWRTTATAVIDVLFADAQAGWADTSAFVPAMEAPVGSLWQQITVMADNTILAKPCCDRYSRLFVEVDGQYVPDDGSRSWPIVMDLEKQDWRGAIRIPRKTIPKTGLLDLSGIVWDGSVGKPLFSLGIGRVPKHYGSMQRRENLLLESQAQANNLAGLLVGTDNLEYPDVPVSLSANNRLIDVTPRQYVTMSLAAADNERGIVWTTKKFLPRSVSCKFEADKGVLLVDINMDEESTATAFTTGDTPPITPPDATPPDIDPIGPPLPIEGTGRVVYASDESRMGRTRSFDTASPSWADITGAISGDIGAWNLDPWNPKDQCILGTSTGIFGTLNLNSAAPVWDTLVTPADFLAATGKVYGYCANVKYTITEDGRVYVQVITADSYLYIGATGNRGASWYWKQIGVTTSGAGIGFAVSQHINTKVLTTCGNGELWYSTDANSVSPTYTLLYTAPSAAYPMANIEWPYAGNLSDLNVYVGGLALGVAPSNVFHFSGSAEGWTGGVWTSVQGYWPPDDQPCLYYFEPLFGNSPVFTYVMPGTLLAAEGDLFQGYYSAARNGGVYNRIVYSDNTYDRQDIAATGVRTGHTLFSVAVSAGNAGKAVKQLEHYLYVGWIGGGHTLDRVSYGFTGGGGTPYIKKSVDGGSNFTDITPDSSGTPGASGLLVYLQDASKLYAFVGDNVSASTLTRSVDNGANWNDGATGLDSPRALGLWPWDNVFIYGVKNGDIIYSEDDGMTFGSKLGDWATEVGAFGQGVNVVPYWLG